MKRILIVSHDAGGANLILYWAINYNYKYDFYLKGPAVKIFKSKFKNIKIRRKIPINVDYSLVITGTSLYSNIEYETIKYFKQKTKTVSMIDHWINYKLRFYRHKKLNYPSEIWVTDRNALTMARKKLKNNIIKLKPNYYLSSMKKDFKKYKNKKIRFKYLFASNNFKKNSYKNPSISMSSKEIFLKFLAIVKNENCNILFRAHPSENKKKYNVLLSKYKNIFFDNNRDFLSSLSMSENLVGCETMALVVANHLGLKTINLDIGIKNIKTIPSKYIDKIIKIK